MLAAEHYPDVFADAVPKHELFEVHRSKISRHHSKAGYDYPTIRLPHSFSDLAGLSTRIYQTFYDGALAFLVVVSQSGGTDKNKLKENAAASSKKPVNALRKLQPDFESLMQPYVMDGFVKEIGEKAVTIQKAIDEEESSKST